MSWELVTSIVTILGILINAWWGYSKKKGNYAEDIKKFDKALSNGDTDTMSAMFDELRIPGSGNPIGQDDTETK